MTPLDLVLAAALLLAPAGTPEPTPDPDRWAGVTAALLQVAGEWEVRDPGAHGLFARPADFQQDLDLLRDWARELADAPPAADAGRWPGDEEANRLRALNRRFRAHLEERLAWEADRADLIWAAIAETDRLYDVWSAVSLATWQGTPVGYSRAALLKLKTLIGAEAYAAGELPSCVPAWAIDPAFTLKEVLPCDDCP